MFSYTRWNQITSTKLLAVVEGTKNENIVCLKGPWFEALELQSCIRKFSSVILFLPVCVSWHQKYVTVSS